MNRIINYLDKLYSNPISELDYSNDFEFLIAVVLSAQTTDKKVNRVTKELFSRYDIKSLKDADINDIKSILRPLGLSSKKAEYIISIASDLYNKYNSNIPNDINELVKLKGVGRKTANLVLSTIYNKPLIAVDTHISRVSKRLGIAEINDTPKIIENKLYKLVPKDKLLKVHLQLVLFGRYKCKAIKPDCKDCELINICNYEKKNV